MNKILSLVICIFLISSCADKHKGEQKPTILSNFIEITDNENNGVQDILNFYGGQCIYSIGASASTVTGNKKYFELEMSKSQIIEDLVDDAEMAASNIAYLFYKNLLNEKENYDEIHSVIIFNDGTKKIYKFSTKQLGLIDEKIILTRKIVDVIKTKSFDDLRPYLYLLSNPEKDELITNIEKIDSQFGNITGFEPYGFKIVETNDKEIAHISGIILRDIKNNAFSIDVDLNIKGDGIYLLHYKL